MSDIGVHSNVYQRVRDYGELIDQVLLGLRSKGSSPADVSRRTLGELLVGIAAVPPSDLQAAWLGMLIGGDVGARAGWARIGRALLSSDPAEPEVLDQLEELARKLEDQRTEALAKMRGIRT
ncbi:MAG: hypothetical protein ACE141_18055 [Bryobacteraceae bacterium]